MRINQNIAALNTYRQLAANNVNTGKSLEKLSSGLRINRAGDDAAGLAISEKMRAQVRGLDQASRNSQDAISLIQTAEGALSETQSILQRMRELAVQSASDTNVVEDRDAIQGEINQLTSEINRISNTTEFNTQKLLNGEKLNDFTVTGTSFSGGANTQNLLGASGKLLTGGSALNSGTYKLVITKNTVMVASGTTTPGTTITTVGVNDPDASGVPVTLTPTVADVHYSGGVQPTFSGTIAITSGTGNMIGSGGDAGSGNFSIELVAGTSGKTIRVTITNDSGVSSIDDITADSGGKFTYNEHGVSFAITSVSGWGSGAANAVSYDKAAGSGVNNTLGTAQDIWTDVSYAGSGTATTAGNSVGNITLSSGINGGNFEIHLVSDGTSGGSYITIKMSGGTSGFVVDDVVSGIARDGYTYSNHGISFTVNLSGLGSGGSGTLKFSVTKQVVTSTPTVTYDKYQTSYTAQLVDASGNNVGSGVLLGTSAAASGAAAQAGSGRNIATAYSGNVGGGLHLNIAANTALTVGSGEFDVNRTTTGKDRSLTFQIGANQAQSMSLSINNMSAKALGVSSASAATGFAQSLEVTNGTSATNSEFGLDVSTTSGAAKAITTINAAINKVSAERSKLGAVQNRLEHTISNLGTSSENLTSAESRVRDVDMAREMMNFTKNNILTQAAQSMLAQANQQPQGVLQLLR
jgi:flagellin